MNAKKHALAFWTKFLFRFIFTFSLHAIFNYALLSFNISTIITNISLFGKSIFMLMLRWLRVWVLAKTCLLYRASKETQTADEAVAWKGRGLRRCLMCLRCHQKQSPKLTLSCSSWRFGFVDANLLSSSSASMRHASSPFVHQFHSYLILLFTISLNVIPSFCFFGRFVSWTLLLLHYVVATRYRHGWIPAAYTYRT